VPGTFIPFFYRYDRLYKDGLIDGHEWKQHRFDFILTQKTHQTTWNRLEEARRSQKFPNKAKISQQNRQSPHLDTSAVGNFPQPSQMTHAT
jgi:hypothetical protein